MAGKQYRYVGNHATELEIGDTRPWVGEGEFITLSDEDASGADVRYLIDTGVLIDVAQVEQQAAAEAKAAEAEEKAAQERAKAEGEAAAATAETATVDTKDTKGGK